MFKNRLVVQCLGKLKRCPVANAGTHTLSPKTAPLPDACNWQASDLISHSVCLTSKVPSVRIRNASPCPFFWESWVYQACWLTSPLSCPFSTTNLNLHGLASPVSLVLFLWYISLPSVLESILFFKTCFKCPSTFPPNLSPLAFPSPLWRSLNQFLSCSTHT